MSQLVKRYSLFFTVLVGFSLLVSPLSVYAQSSEKPQLPVTDSLKIGYVNKDIKDVTDYYQDYFCDSSKWYSGYSDEHCNFITKSFEVGTAIVVQRKLKNSQGDYNDVYIVVSNSNSKLNIESGNGTYGYYVNFLLINQSFSFKSYNLDTNGKIAYSTSMKNYIMNYSNSSLYHFSGKYENVDPSLYKNFPNRKPLHLPGTSSFRFNDNCGLDIGCHFGNVLTFFKSIISFIVGIFDFSENNSLLKLLKWLFIPDNFSDLFSVQSISDDFKNTLSPIYSAISSLNKLLGSFVPPAVGGVDAYCNNSFSPTHHDSESHIYLLKSKVFGSDFNPDICSFERSIGGPKNMQKIRYFTSAFLFAITLYLLYMFLKKIFEERF